MKKFIEYISTAGDYAREKHRIISKIINRQSRGNVAAQNGWFLTREKLEEMSKKANSSIQRLSKIFPRSA